jgi:hypothetical protein
MGNNKFWEITIKRATILFLLPLTAIAGDGLGDFFVAPGATSVANCGSLITYWHGGPSLTAGLKIPLTLKHDYQETWLELAYHNFLFDASSNGPISSPYEDITFWGKDVSILEFSVNSRIYFRNVNSLGNTYALFGVGYLKRSPTEMRSNSFDLPYIKRTYKGAEAYNFGLGFIHQMKKRAYLFFEISYVRSYTIPHRTSFWKSNFGIKFK